MAQYKWLVPLSILSIVLQQMVLGTLARTEAQQQDVDIARTPFHFATDFYKAAVSDTEGNVAASPYSLLEALAMTALGARGQTEAELSAGLGFPQRNLNLQEFRSRLKGQNQVTFRSANRLWVGEEVVVTPTFLEQTQTVFGAQPETVEFRTASESARRRINQWVSEQTERKIEELLPKGAIGPLTEAVLTNAVYFLGKWQTQFDAAKTKTGPFYTDSPGGASVEAMFMTQEGTFSVMRRPTFDAIELSYTGSQFAMTFLVPKSGSVFDIERELSPELLHALYGGSQEERVTVIVPKFSVKARVPVEKALTKMGLERIFRGGDFSGIAPTIKGISGVFHEVAVDVTEAGTEAAAATGVAFTRSVARPKPKFNIDRPFLFIIRDKATSFPLFMGRITDPRAGIPQ